MPDDVAVTENPPRTERGGKNVTCAFCECVIAPDGGVLRTSERQKKLLAFEDKNATLTREVERLTAELAARPPAPAPQADPVDTPRKRFGLR